MNQSSGTRLDSWKEIAQYLGRYERTVQRWELERNLPVHRLPGAKRGGVFAYTGELDGWLAQTPGLLEPEQEADEPADGNGAAALPVATEHEHPAAAADAPTEAAPAASVARTSWRIAFITIVLAGVVALAFYFGYRQSQKDRLGGKAIEVQQLTFRRGNIRSARFRPDGGNLVYAATWGDAPGYRLYETSLDRPESSPLHGAGAQLLAISRSSTLAILLNPQFIGPFMQFGTLAVQGLYEDKPVAISPNVSWADWSTDGSTLYYSVVDDHGISWIESYSLESHQTSRIYPRTPMPDAHFIYLRASPSGNRIAFGMQTGMEDGGKVVILPLSGGEPTVSRHFDTLAGLAWPANEKEVWFTAAEEGLVRGIYAMNTSGQVRMVYRAPVALTLQDISRNGNVLVTRNLDTSDVMARKLENGASEVVLSMFDWSSLGDISEDGKRVAIFEAGDAKRKPTIYLRDSTGGPATALGEAMAPVSFSPDGKSLAALSDEPCPRVVLLSPERGPQVMTRTNLCVQRAIWTPDARRIVFDAAEPGHKSRCYVQTIGIPDLHAFSAEDVHCPLVSPDGRYALGQNDSGIGILKIASDETQKLDRIDIPSLKEPSRLRPIRWLEGNRVVATTGMEPALLVIDLKSKRITTIPVQTPTRLESLFALKVSDDLKTVAYSGYGMSSSLFFISGLR